jgi:hypothetical protein
MCQCLAANEELAAKSHNFIVALLIVEPFGLFFCREKIRDYLLSPENLGTQVAQYLARLP